MKNYILRTIALLAFSVSIVNAQQNSGLAFLKLDVDARAASMAGAFTALTNDASAAYWNPAGLGLAEDMNFMGMYTDLFAGIKHGFISAQFATGTHALALSFNYQHIPGIEIRDETPTEQAAGTVDVFNLAAAISYATTYDEWHVGGSLKYIFEKYYLASAPGWAVDLGVLKKNFYGGIDLGIVVQNLGKMSRLDRKASKLPVTVSSGLTYKIPSFFDDNLLVATDLQWIRDEKIYLKFGLQYYLSEYFVIRGGLKNGNDDLLWSGGFGINFNSLHLDYAYAPWEYELGTTNRFSLGVYF